MADITITATPLSDIPNIVSVADFKHYARIDITADDALIESQILPAAVEFVESYTGQNYRTASKVPAQIITAIMSIGSHFYDCRSAAVPFELKKVPFSVQAILDAHKVIEL